MGTRVLSVGVSPDSLMWWLHLGTRPFAISVMIQIRYKIRFIFYVQTAAGQVWPMRQVSKINMGYLHKCPSVLDRFGMLLGSGICDYHSGYWVKGHSQTQRTSHVCICSSTLHHSYSVSVSFTTTAPSSSTDRDLRRPDPFSCLGV